MLNVTHYPLLQKLLLYALSSFPVVQSSAYQVGDAMTRRVEALFVRLKKGNLTNEALNEYKQSNVRSLLEYLERPDVKVSASKEATKLAKSLLRKNLRNRGPDRRYSSTFC